MAHDDYIINRKTQSVLDMGDGFRRFCIIAQRDLAWVTDRALLVGVMTDALADWDCAKQPGRTFPHTVEWHVQLIWEFVQGAAAEDIEFTWHAEIDDWEAFDRLKTFYLYGDMRPDSFICVDHFIVNHRTKSMLALGKEKWFHSWAGRDKSWVLDPILTQVVVEEARGQREGESEASVRELAACIWDFVKGAKPEEIELLIEGECARYREYSVL